MHIYIDLSIINFVINIFISFTFANIITNYNIKDELKHSYLLIPIVISYILNIYYVPYFFMFIAIIEILACFLFSSKLAKLMIFNLIFYLINTAFLFLLGGTVIVEGILFINRPFIIFFSLLYPFLVIIIYLSSKYVFERLKNNKYIIKCEVRIGEYLIKENGYFDSGNNLKINDIPVIFINGRKIDGEGEMVNIKTVNGNKMHKAYKGELTMLKKKYKVYVIFLSFDIKFVSCLILLNSNLM